MNSRIAQLRLLLISDGFDDDTAARVQAALAALPPGVAAVQLRAKALDGRALYAAATTLLPIVHARGGLLLVNDRLDVARAAGADGVHLPARGLSPDVARRLGERLVLGVSTHVPADVPAAFAAGADYVTFGPLFDTPGKGPPVGVAALAAVVADASGPVFGLGGIGAANVRQIVAAGARVACIGAVLGSRDPAAGARSLWDAAAIG